jgi:membrane dipeptidase
MGHEARSRWRCPMAAHLLWMERASHGRAQDMPDNGRGARLPGRGTIAGLMHMEGAEAIDEGLDALHRSMRWGCGRWGRSGRVRRSLAMACRLPFPAPRYRPGPDRCRQAPCARMQPAWIMLDLSHLNEAGFNDVARLSDAPLVATHSNATAVDAIHPQPDRPPAGDDPRQPRHGGAELSPPCSCAKTGASPRNGLGPGPAPP